MKSLLLSLSLLACWTLHADVGRGETQSTTAKMRRPVALATDESGRLYVANRDAGTISIVDTKQKKVLSETPVGKRLADLAFTQGVVVAVDEAASELITLRTENKQTKLEIISRLPVATTPVDIAISPNSHRWSVASLWSRRVALIDATVPAKPRMLKVVDLPFAAREQLWLSDKHLLVMDAFGGRLGIVDSEQGVLQKIHLSEAHNIRGVALTADKSRVVFAHQILHRDRSTTLGGVHWGGVMSNVLQTVSVRHLLNGEGTLPIGGIYYLGEPDHATGDPSGLATTRDKRHIVAYAGVDEVGVSDPGANYFRGVKVGARPTALLLSPDQRQVFVANTFGDSISIIDVASAKVTGEIKLGMAPVAALNLASQGELLFYNSRLSSDGWYSCHSCHTDGHTNSRLNDNLSDGSFYSPKRVLSLLGVAKTAPWAWNGMVDRLDQQVRKSVTITMRGEPLTDNQTRALTAYLHSLNPPPSLVKARGESSESKQSALKGKALFAKLNCNQCHKPGQFTTPDTYDVGIHDETGETHFNPPSLLSVSQRDRLFHDNRATSLRDVLTKHRHNLSSPLSLEEVDDLVAYLQSL